MVKVMTIGDLHFKNDNIETVDIFLLELLQLVKKETPDLIVVLGDLLHYHARIHTTPLNKVSYLIEKLSKLAPTYVLVGNHDMINPAQFLTTNHWMNVFKNWKNVVVVDKIQHLTLKGKFLTFVPFVPKTRFKEALNTSNQDWTKSDLIFAHQDFNGCKMGAITATDADKWEVNDPPVVSGHIHSRQFLFNNERFSVENYQKDYPLKKGVVYYSGSAFQHAFGESHHKMIGCIQIKEDEPLLTEHKLNIPCKRIYTIEAKDISKLLEKPETKDKIRINIKATAAEFKVLKKTKEYKKLVEKGYKIELKNTNVENQEIHENMNEESFTKLLYNQIERSDNLSELSDFYHLIHSKSVDFRPDRFRFYKKNKNL